MRRIPLRQSIGSLVIALAATAILLYSWPTPTIFYEGVLLLHLVLGVVFCWNIDSIKDFASWITGATVFDPSVYYLTKLPADINPHETGAIVVMALVLSVIATLYPSWRASRLDPVEALRYE